MSQIACVSVSNVLVLIIHIPVCLGSRGKPFFLNSSKCPKPFTGIEEHCLGEGYEGGSRLSKCDGKLIMDLIWFKVKKQLKRERVCIA
jgi:hypothetical protein